MLQYVAVLTDNRALHDVRECPNAGSGTHMLAFNARGFMFKKSILAH